LIFVQSVILTSNDTDKLNVTFSRYFMMVL